MVLRAGIEPARPQGTQDFLTSYDFRRLLSEKVICGLDFIFTFYLHASSQAEAVKSLRFFEKNVFKLSSVLPFDRFHRI